MANIQVQTIYYYIAVVNHLLNWLFQIASVIQYSSSWSLLFDKTELDIFKCLNKKELHVHALYY